MGFLKRLMSSPSNKEIIIVSGLPRSGTSMMMKMLEAGGIAALTDEIRTADSDNPKGYYEFERVKKMDKGDVGWLAEAQGKAVKVISALLKHLPADYRYRVIFMRRHMPEILASQRRMLGNRGEAADDMDDEKLATLFSKHLQSVEEWLREQDHMPVLYVHYSDMMTDPHSQIRRISEFLGKKLDADSMVREVDPELYRNRRSPAESAGSAFD